MANSTASPALTRRQALGLFGAAGAVTVIGFGRRSAAADCTVTPAETEGPYFVDELLNRADITVDPTNGTVHPGVPLRLRINVTRADDGCTPAEGVQVDVWHCDAGGLYSDESANGTVGRKFLRGYQVTDANGAVEFTTIYPGWYSGRTIHIHFKLRTFTGTQTTFEFTSQLFFDDTVTNQVVAQSPYNTRGTRNTTNANDNIYNGTTALLLALTSDGSGGYVGTFTAGVEGIPATTGGGSDTCSDIASCRSAVTAALPSPSAASTRKARKVARKLARLNTQAGTQLDRAAAASGTMQSHLYRKARATLSELLARAQAAATKGTLGVSVTTLAAAVAALLSLVPS